MLVDIAAQRVLSLGDISPVHLDMCLALKYPGTLNIRSSVLKKLIDCSTEIVNIEEQYIAEITIGSIHSSTLDHDQPGIIKLKGVDSEECL